MAKLSHWIWLVAGLLITIVASFVDLMLFFYLGIIFLMIGLGKALIYFMTRDRESKSEQKETNAYFPELTNCPSCTRQVRTSQNFCHNCGNRLK